MWSKHTLTVCMLLTTSACAVHKLPVNIVPRTIPSPAPVEGLLNIPKSDPLAPGARPVVITISTDPERNVSRSALTWTYRCGGGPSQRGGSAVFDSTGGSVLGQIDKDCSAAVVDMSAIVDYSNPRITDFVFQISVPVTPAGVNHIFSVTSSRIATIIYLDIRKGLRKKDHATLAWKYQSASSPQVVETGSADIPLDQLLTARTYVLPIQLNIPVRNLNDGTIHVELTGIIDNRPAHWQQDFQPATAGIEIQFVRGKTEGRTITNN